jgi:hypothetical protein
MKELAGGGLMKKLGAAMSGAGQKLLHRPQVAGFRRPPKHRR